MIICCTDNVFAHDVVDVDLRGGVSVDVDIVVCRVWVEMYCAVVGGCGVD